MSKNKKNHHVSRKTEENCIERKDPIWEKDTSAPSSLLCDSKTECKCSDGCKCGSECKCSDGCKCGSGSSGATIAQCFTLLLGALMISTAILFVGMEMSRPKIAQHSNGNIDLQITDYMRRNVDVVTQIMDSHQEKLIAEKEAEMERQRIEAEMKLAEKAKEYESGIINDPTNYSLGNRKGKYVIIEFFDYNCGWCKKTNKAIWNEIEAKKAPNIRWIPIDAPIFGEPSAIISRYVLAAGKQGKYVEMHHAVSSSEKRVDQEALIAFAKEIGLDIEQLKKDAESEEIKSKLEDNIKMAQEIGIRGVPFMIVNGKPQGGALLGESLENAIKESNEM